MDGAEAATADKQRLRDELLDARRRRSTDDLTRARAAICRHVLDRVAGASCVAGYVPLRTEPGSVELLAGLVAMGARVLVPLTRDDRDLDWAPWAPDGAGDPLGVDAVAEAGLVLVPALAVAADGTRLGRGGGWYDRALTRRAINATVAALLFDDEMVAHLPHDRWDQPVDAAITPSGWRTLGRNTDVRVAR